MLIFFTIALNIKKKTETSWNIFKDVDVQNSSGLLITVTLEQAVGSKTLILVNRHGLVLVVFVKTVFLVFYQMIWFTGVMCFLKRSPLLIAPW